jgi:prophage tail gpP-like protein
MRRPVDRITVESEQGTFDRFNSIEITNEIGAPTQCVMDVGDDNTYAELVNVVSHGRRFRVYLNDRLRMTGRVYIPNTSGSAANGSTTQITIRGTMADAFYASADPKIRVEKATIRDFLLKLYAPYGITERDFVFRADVERDLMTGRGTRGQAAPADLRRITAKEAKVNPPETVREAAEKHLKRYGLMHWEAPDGKIFVGAPDDQQLPLYRFASKRGWQSHANNLLEWQRIADWSDVPSEVAVHGALVGEDFDNRKRVKTTAAWADVQAAGFHRPVLIMDDGSRSASIAQARANRERANRSKRKDCYELTVDGWSYWDGTSAIPYGVNTTCDVDIDAIGSPSGLYYISAVTCTGSPNDGASTRLTLVAPGIFEV